ncbi:hypothetical protein [Microbacterium sp.]|uniref:hypothetical protein n=1 Tax=Microbacterium sp. TaxID=51671 RepID=UPI003F70FCC8
MNTTKWVQSTIIFAAIAAAYVAGAASPSPEPTPSPTITQAPAQPTPVEPTPVETIPAQPEPTAVPSTQTIAGTFRRVSATSWAMLDDAGHTSIGVDRIEVRADRLRVWHTFRASKVVTVQVTPDESFASAGVRVGASVGFAYTDVFFYMGASQTPVKPALLTKAGANVWITGLFLVP